MKDNHLKLELLDIKEIVPFEHNANKHPESQIEELVESIKELGLLNPLLVCPDGKGKYDLVGGHGRLIALSRLKVEKVPCLVTEEMSYEDATALAANLADNEIARHSESNLEEIRWSLKELVSHNIDPIYSGYDEETQKSLMVDTEINEGDDFENIEGTGKLPSKKDTISVNGDLFELGNHRLMCGSSDDEQDVERLMDGEEARLLITDPPYNVDYKRKDGKTGQAKAGTGIMNDAFEDDLAYERWLTDVFGIAKNVMDKKSAYYVFYASRKSEFVHKALREAGMTVRQVIAWVKDAIVLDWSDYHWKHEPCVYGEKTPDDAVYEDSAISYGFDNKTERVWRNDHAQPTVIEANKPKNSKLHPTMKPIVVLGYLMRNSSHPTDIVLDLFGGSGSTLIACEKLNRKCRMMELDPRYVDVIIRRYGEETNWEVPIYKITEVGSRLDKEDVREKYKEKK